MCTGRITDAGLFVVTGNLSKEETINPTVSSRSKSVERFQWVESNPLNGSNGSIVDYINSKLGTIQSEVSIIVEAAKAVPKLFVWVLECHLRRFG